MVLTAPPSQVTKGWRAHPFMLPDFNHKVHNLNDLSGKNGTMIAFICNHCPYVKKVIGQLVADASFLIKHGVSTIAIMSNDWRAYPDDSPENMKRFASEHHFSFPYLIDESQDVARNYAAVCTPDFFGFDSGLNLQYRGRIMDPGHSGSITEDSDLRLAMMSVAQSGTAHPDQHASLGCSIKWRS